MKLSAIHAEETAFLHLNDLEDAPLYEAGEDGSPDTSKPVGITMYGPGSKTYAKANQARQNKIFSRMKKKGNVEMSADEAREENAVFLASITKQLHYIEPEDGSTGDAAIKAVYLDTASNVAEQAAKFAADWANFKKPSATT